MPFGPIDGDQEGTGKLSKKGEHLKSHLQVIQFGIMQEPVETGQGTVDLTPCRLRNKGGHRNGGGLSHPGDPLDDQGDRFALRSPQRTQNLPNHLEIIRSHHLALSFS